MKIVPASGVLDSLGQAAIAAGLARAALEAAGRDPGTARIVPFGSQPSHDKLDHFETIGVTECVFRLPSAPESHVLSVLDEQAALIAARR